MQPCDAKQLKMGQRVKFIVCYPRSTAARFWPAPDSQPGGRQGWVREPIPLDWGDGEHTGVVVGLRSVLMGNYEYRRGGTSGEGDDDSPYASGTRETVLLVALNIYKEPIIVRAQDAEVVAICELCKESW